MYIGRKIVTWTPSYDLKKKNVMGQSQHHLKKKKNEKASDGQGNIGTEVQLGFP